MTNHVVSNPRYGILLRAVVASTRRGLWDADGAGLLFTIGTKRIEDIYARDCPFSAESIQEESLVPRDGRYLGSGLRTGQLCCGQQRVQEARSTRTEDTSTRPKVGTV